MKVKIIIILGLVFLLAVFVFSYDDVKNLSLPAGGIRELRIDCGAGFLKVTGGEAQTAIEVKAEIYIGGVDKKEADDYFRDHVKLTLERRGDQAVLTSRIEGHRVFFFSDEARIDLTVRLPRATDLRIDDGSGSLTVENLKGNVYIEDGSGGIQVEDIVGNLEIEDNSGDIDVKDISGNVSVDDGSGGIQITVVGGSVTVNDGSGSINIDGVDKDVIIESAGSGGIQIRNVKGRVIK